MLLCHSSTLLRKYKVQNDFNGCDSFHVKSYENVVLGDLYFVTCYYDAVTLRLPAKQFSHCIALTIKRA